MSEFVIFAILELHAQLKRDKIKSDIYGHVYCKKTNWASSCQNISSDM